MVCPECGEPVELAASIVMGQLVVTCEGDCGWYVLVAHGDKGRRIAEQLRTCLAELANIE